MDNMLVEEEKDDNEWHNDLKNLELILNQAKDCFSDDGPLSCDKSKSNPLLDSLLDKPLDRPINDSVNSEQVSEESENSNFSIESYSDDDEEKDHQISYGDCENISSSESNIEEEGKRNLKNKSCNVQKKKRKSVKQLLRKNIKKIISEESLTDFTLTARKAEEERIQRLNERSQMIINHRAMKINKNNSLHIPSNGVNDIILSSDNEDSNSNISTTNTVTNEEIIDIISDDESKNESTPRNGVVKDLSNYNDSDDDCQTIEDVEVDDANNCSEHTDDTLNVADSEGRILVNIGHPDEDPDIFLSHQLAKALKPHQIGGIRFLYDNVIENCSQFQISPGLGCILAHSMGLGKTLQLISFIHVFLNYTSAKHVICIVPINTIQNWISEFHFWLPEKAKDANSNCDAPCSVTFRNFGLYSLGDCKNLSTRVKEIMLWWESGGVLLLGYEIYRQLAGAKSIDGEVEDKDSFSSSNRVTCLKAALIDPGPDLIICDEGHRIKNVKTATSKVLKNIKTKRRIVLTGYPLQNNLMEYWCMVDFIRPNFLGTKQEFTNMFERPIQNGQCVDSTPNDRKLMRMRAHVLYSLLRGFVQRRSHSILTKSLPKKHEHVILTRMTPIQRSLMIAFINKMKNDPMNNNALKINPILLFGVCLKIWNHPDILYHQVLNEGKLENDLDLDLPTKKNPNSNKTFKENNLSTNMTYMEQSPSTSEYFPQNQRTLDFEWARPFLVNYEPLKIENGVKTIILFEIIKKSLLSNDRILIFSQSLLTLNVIEGLLALQQVPQPPNGEREMWHKNVNYYRIDGSTSPLEREKLINNFNRNNKVYLFLLSTRAGCLGINLVGANRIVIFDASWNPCHDAQAACRIYRYGQKKECFIYRLICDFSLEKKVYDRQVSKQEMSHRIVDELNPETNLTWKDINSLVDDIDEICNPKIQNISPKSLPDCEDDIIRHICQNMTNCISKVPFEHESLLLDIKETKLSKREKKIAEESYLLAKQARVLSNHGISSSSNMALPRYSPFVCNDTYPYCQNSSYNGGNYHSNAFMGPTEPLYKGLYNGTNQLSIEEPSRNYPVQAPSSKCIKLHADLNIPGDPTTNRLPIFVPKGCDVKILRTENGLYLQTQDARIISLNLSATQWSRILNERHRHATVAPGNAAMFKPSTSTTYSNSTHSIPEVIDLSDDE